MAFIIQRKNRWFAVWRNEGRRVCKTTGIAVKGRAEKKLAQMTADAMEATAKQTTNLNNALDAVRKAADALDIKSRVPSIQDYFNNFEADGKKSNKKNFCFAKDRFLRFLGEAAVKRIDTLLPSTCREFLLEEAKRISYGTVKRYHAALSCAMTRALNDDLIPFNPFSRISIAKLIPASERRPMERLPFTREEMAFMLREFPLQWRELITVSFLTGGQRIGDMACLEWSSIDLKENTIALPEEKTGKLMKTPMHPILRALIDTKVNNNSNYVFPVMAQRYNRSKGCLSTEFTTLLKMHGIIEEEKKVLQGDRRNMAKKSFHSIRHTVVSILRSSTIFSADVTREIVGHKSDIVERMYFTLEDSMKAKAFSYLMAEIQKEGEQ